VTEVLAPGCVPLFLTDGFKVLPPVMKLAKTIG
jgi:hypothetical protein